MTSQHSTGPQLHLNNMFIIQMLSFLTGAIGLPWACPSFWGLCISWASLSLVHVRHGTAQAPPQWILAATRRGHEQLTIDGPQLPMVWLTDFRFYDVVKAICTQEKSYLKFWILVFSQAIDMRTVTPCDAGQWQWASAPVGHRATRVNNQYCIVHWITTGFCILCFVFLHSTMSTKCHLCLLLLVRKRGRRSLLRWNSR